MPSEHAFVITVHQAERIIEVRYPHRPTLEAYEIYERDIRAAIKAMGSPWDCLVDQSALSALAPEFTPRIADLNHWARKQGMRHTTRVISESAIGELQGMRILKQAGVQDVGSLFRSREEAWASLRSQSLAREVSGT
jgi:hypothetical protein